MKLHTKLTEQQVRHALVEAQLRGRVTHDVEFAILAPAGSRSHDHAFEFQLGTDDKYSLPKGYVDRNGHKMNVRRYTNNGAGVYAATWHEWGWFMVEVFDLDPDAMFGSKSWGYESREDFDQKTKYAFDEG